MGTGVLLAAALAATGVWTGHLAVFAAAAWAHRPPQWAPESPRRVAVLIPGYREGEVLVRCAESVLAQEYPQERVEVVVIADHCGPQVLSQLRALPITVHALELEVSTKARSLRHALAHLDERVEAVVVLDADNLMAPGSLDQLLRPLSAGFSAVQGWRVEKNRDSDMARLDGAMERINTAIFREGRAAAGLSASLAGSGMAFERWAFVRWMTATDAVGGFDKQLEALILGDGARIAWAPDAIVYDEKVGTARALSTQRRRWLSAQLVFLRRYGAAGLGRAWRLRSLDLFDKLAQWAAPPRSLLLLGVFALTCGSALLGQWAAFWLGLAQLAVLGATLVTALSALGGRIGMAELRAAGPAALAMVGALLRLRGADRRFLHTPHTVSVGLDGLHQEG